MKRPFAALLLFAALMIFSADALASTYYVSPTGSDSNAGSQAKPWASLQHAVDAVQPGDTIIVESGTYAGCRIGNSGTAAAVCTLKADSGVHVVVNSAGSANKHNSNIEIENFDGTIQYWVIDGIESTNSGRYGIDIRDTDHVTVQNCYVHNSALTGIFLAFSYYPLIQNNESAFNGEHGIYQSNSGDNPTIRGNKLHNNASAGLHMNGDRNFTPGDGIISFALVEKNIIYENGTSGASGINCDGVSDSIIRNNLLYNNHASGISLYATDGAEGSSRNKVFNNTIVMAAGSRWCINIPASDEGQPNPTGNQIENNILYTPVANHGSVLIYQNSVPGFVSDYNATIGRFSTDSGDSVLSLQAWQALGYDQHSIVAQPADLFINVGANDYHLKKDSTAVGGGIALADVTDDLDGNPRPSGGHYSIGAYEELTNPVPAAVDFSATPVSGVAPLIVQFTDLSTGGVNSWSWDFGDGGSSTLQNPSHTYLAPGKYTVKLTASGPSFSDQKIKTDLITVKSTSGTFSPASFTIVSGILKSGDLSRIIAADKSYLKVKSVSLDGHFGDVLQYDFQTTLDSAATPSITIRSVVHPTVAPQQEQISLFNFSTNQYDLLAIGSIDFTDNTTTTVSITNPSVYISSTGEIRLQIRTGDSNTPRWKHFIDLIQLTAGS